VLESTAVAQREDAILFDKAQIGAALSRVASEIARANPATAGLAFVGIRTRGVHLARRLAALLGAKGDDAPAPVGVLDITLYRDDLSDLASQPVVRATELPFAIDGRRIVLVDDVLFTGRTVRCAIDEIIDFGRPQRIELAVLVDRGGRELPIKADYVGLTVEMPGDELVQVLVEEEDGRDEVVRLLKTP
jgi:pyrimidine operon attenuation protein/uracil phosphoribosyltransferase